MKRSEPDRVRCPTRRLRSPFPLAKNQNFDQKKGPVYLEREYTGPFAFAGYY